ncbi:MAG: class I SAM-dependent methyltransferase, partial [Fuerstiella sp.]|nr:class I SAM-dependent methyltransferase [Fuerstiella sp.]
MQSSHLQQLVDLEDSYWWHVAKRQLVTRLLQKHCPPPGRLVEGGIGSGRNLVEFQELGYNVTGFDLMAESVEHVR